MNASDLPDETLFEGALKCRTPAERAAYLDQACADQPELHRKLEALLQAHDQSGEFLEPAVAAARPTIKLELAPEETSGTMIGGYKLLQKIGEGGMGVVYMAEQTEPVVRKVALKIIKLGMDTKQVVARFEAERQALALMDHPNIAKILDAGVTESSVAARVSPAVEPGFQPGGKGAGSSGRIEHSEVAGLAGADPGGKMPPSTAGETPAATHSTGRPYFVMELVHGVPITEYCDKNKLSTQQRLELFIPVCQAIQHAHQKGIIHRDIKPSNVMVTLHDGVPVPKVIDFGVAKATNQRLTEKTLFTHYAQMIGTPAYMSPEQAEMSGLDIDTRTDVYSLGVLLYELLTGSTPFNAKELLSKGYAEMQRIIAQEEPPKPSTRMSTLRDEERTVVASNHSVAVSALSKALQGDLDWIVMKCLEKDRTRRYETSNGLAADLRRHLSNELITARPPTTGYLLKKLIKRNKLAFAAGAAIAAVLIIATGISTWQAVRATKAEALVKERLLEVAAERDAKEQAWNDAEEISRFLANVFQSPDPSRDGRTIQVVELLDRAARELETDLTSQPDHRANLQAVLGKTYSALGLYGEAIPLQEKARDFYLSTSGPEHPNTLLAMHNLANSYEDAYRRDEALKLREQVLALRRKVKGPEHPETLKAMGNLAFSYYGYDRRDEALKLREEVLTLYRKVLGPEHPDTLGAMNNLALSYFGYDRRDEAFKLREDVLALSRKVLGPEHPDTVGAMQNLAASYYVYDRRDEALKLQEDVLALRRKLLGPEHPDTIATMMNLAAYYFYVSRGEEALKLREEVLTLSRKVFGPEQPHTILPMDNLAESYAAAGRRDEAIRLHEEGMALRRKAFGPEHPDTLWAMIRLASGYRKLNRPNDAVRLGQETLALFRKTSSPTNALTLNAMTELAISFRFAGRIPEAISLERDSLRLKHQHLSPNDPMLIESFENLAACYEQSDQKPEAEALRRELAELKAKSESQKPAVGQSPIAPAKP